MPLAASSASRLPNPAMCGRIVNQQPQRPETVLIRHLSAPLGFLRALDFSYKSLGNYFCWGNVRRAAFRAVAEFTAGDADLNQYKIVMLARIAENT